MKEEKKVKRLQIDIALSSFERLTRLKESTEAASFAEVTSRAYRVLEFMKDATDNGKKIVLRSPNGEETIVEFI